MNLLVEILWVFIIFSFLGWLFKFTVNLIKKRKLTNPGFITLPFLPSYGIGMTVIFVLFSNVKNDFIVFFASAIFLTFYKYLLARFFERSFGFKWNNYSKKSFTLNGYVSIWEPFLYGIIAFLTINFAVEPLSSLLSLIPFWLAILIPAIIAGMIIADCCISVFTVINLRRNLKKMSDISTLLEDNNSGVSDEELRRSYEQRLLKSKHFRLRLVRAFPDMQSLDYEKQLSDIKKQYDIIKEKNEETYEKKIENKDERPFAYGLCFTKLFWLFVIGSVFGTILETIWCLFVEKRFEMRVGMVIGPFIPVYGGGAVAITLCLYKLHKLNDILVYIASGVIGATFEYLCSYFQEMFLGSISWDYSDTPFNIDGRTNLMFALIWGALGLVWLRYLYPVISRTIERIPKKKGKSITIILVVFMIFDTVLSVAAINRKNERAENIPPKTVVGQTIDVVFNDDYMNFIFPHMGTKETFAEGRKNKDK